jgi:hypothetical protein
MITSVTVDTSAKETDLKTRTDAAKQQLMLLKGN